jgi:hypothetical protein
MASKAPLPESVNPKEFAQALDCPMATLRYRIKAGIVPAPVRYGRMLRWPRAVVEAYLATGTVTAKAVL